jgi:hypothetical protein
MSEEQRRGRVFVGNEGRGYLAISILDYSKEGWATAAIEIFADVWRGEYQGDFYSGELVALALSLERLYLELRGTAHWSPIEQFLDLTFVGDARGHILIEGKAQNSLSVWNTLIFRLELDQTELPKIISDLKACEMRQCSK